MYEMWKRKTSTLKSFYKFMNIKQNIENITFTTSEHLSVNMPKPKKIVGWYIMGSKTKEYSTSFGTYYKPNFIKRFFMGTLLDFHWVKEEQ